MAPPGTWYAVKRLVHERDEAGAVRGFFRVAAGDLGEVVAGGIGEVISRGGAGLSRRPGSG